MNDINEDIRADINNFINKTFVTTADENYILARQAFFLEFYTDFFWLSVHAIEKYMKSILLFHDENSQGYSHDIVKLYEKINELGIKIPAFEKPSFISDDLWFEEAILYYGHENKEKKGYLFRLYERGNQNSRYMLNGYNQMHSDLFKVDHIVYHLRKSCRPLRMNKDDQLQAAMARLYEQPKYWQLSPNLPLEKLSKDSNRSELLTNLNHSFAPDIKHDLTKWTTSSKSSPFSEYIHQMKGNIPLTRRKRINRFLNWIQERINCPDKIIKYVRNPNSNDN